MIVIAHRGNSAHFPENTLASFDSALEIGAEYVELDVQLTSDGEVVVLHDPTVDRTTDGHGPISDLTLAQARRLCAGCPSRFGSTFATERIPTLREVLELVRGRARVLVEIKAGGARPLDDGVEALTIRTIHDCGVADSVALLSFDGQALGRCLALAPQIPRGRLYFEATAGQIVAGCKETGCTVAMPHKSLLTDEVASAVREAGLDLGVWVVDDPAELPMLRRYAPFGVASNDPGAILTALRADSATPHERKSTR